MIRPYRGPPTALWLTDFAAVNTPTLDNGRGLAVAQYPRHLPFGGPMLIKRQNEVSRNSWKPTDPTALSSQDGLPQLEGRYSLVSERHEASPVINEEPAGRWDAKDDLNPQLVRYVSHLLVNRYHVKSADVDDLLSDITVDYLTALHRDHTSPGGLFITIALRRACDYWRHIQRLRPVPRSQPAAINLDHLEAAMLQRQLERFLSNWPVLRRDRLLGVLREILGGASFPEACRTMGIPRGSQGRYREALRACFQNTVHNRGARASRSRQSHP